jgi:hypothetical protein
MNLSQTMKIFDDLNAFQPSEWNHQPIIRDLLQTNLMRPIMDII